MSSSVHRAGCGSAVVDHGDGNYRFGMLIRVLGPLVVGPPDAPVSIATRKTRQVIVLLTLAAPGSMSAEQLVDALWDDPPPAAVKTVQSHVSRARGVLAAATGSARPIVGSSRGYALALSPQNTDVGRDTTFRRVARDAMARDDHSTAASLLADARDLWRGEAELPQTRAGEIERVRLHERQLALIEDHVSSLLELGRLNEVLEELTKALSVEPTRERFWALRMLALYRSGRQADALRAYQDIRRLLADELGLDPGPELRHLEAAILAHAPELDAVSDRPTISYAVDLPRYAAAGDRHIAFAIFGDADRDLLVLTPGFITIDAYLEEPALAAALGRLTVSWRVVALDRSGLGLSDPVLAGDPPTVDRWVEDVVAVLDAIAATHVDVLANADTGSLALALAAAHPSRVRSLTLFDAFARATPADGYPYGYTPGQLDEIRTSIRDPGSPGVDHLRLVAPSMADDDQFRAWWDRVGRRAASPATAHLLHHVIAETDVRAVLPRVEVPVVLVVSRCPSYDRAHGRFLVEHLSDARILETDDTDGLWWLADLDLLIGALSSTYL